MRLHLGDVRELLARFPRCVAAWHDGERPPATHRVSADKVLPQPTLLCDACAVVLEPLRPRPLAYAAILRSAVALVRRRENFSQ